MPSLEPIKKKDLAIMLMKYALENSDGFDLDEYFMPIRSKPMMSELSLLNGVSKQMIKKMLNDMIECDWIENYEDTDYLLITAQGRKSLIKMQENVKAEKHSRELRKQKR